MAADSDGDDRIAELRARVAELESKVPDGPTRRQVVAGGGLLGLGGLLGGGASQQVSAQSAAGQIGTSSEPVDVEAAGVNAGSVNTGDGAGDSVAQDVADEAAAILRANGGSKSLILQNRDAVGTASERKAQQYWFNSDGSMLGSLNMRHNQNRGDLADLNIYIRGTAFGGDDTLQKKMTMLNGPGQHDTILYDTNNFRIVGEDSSAVNVLTDSPSGQYSGQLMKEAGDDKAYTRWNPTGFYEIYNSAGGFSHMRYYEDGLAQLRNGRFGLNGNPLLRIRSLSNASPADLETDETAFDTDRGGTGSTAWLHKTGGSVYYWDADGTL